MLGFSRDRQTFLGYQRTIKKGEATRSLVKTFEKVVELSAYCKAVK